MIEKTTDHFCEIKAIQQIMYWMAPPQSNIDKINSKPHAHTHTHTHTHRALCGALWSPVGLCGALGGRAINFEGVQGTRIYEIRTPPPHPGNGGESG